MTSSQQTSRHRSQSSNRRLSRGSRTTPFSRIDWFASLLEGAKHHCLNSTHLRYRRLSDAKREFTLILLDTSGSVRTCGAISTSKGVLLDFFRHTYIGRQSLELIGFGGDKINTLYKLGKPPRDSRPLIDAIGAGGGTPLRRVLQHAAKRLQLMNRQYPTATRRLIIFTDARSRDHIDDLVLMAKTHIIDTEQTTVRLARARGLAESIGASYQHIDDLLTPRGSMTY